MSVCEICCVTISVDKDKKTLSWLIKVNHVASMIAEVLGKGQSFD